MRTAKRRIIVDNGLDRTTPEWQRICEAMATASANGILREMKEHVADEYGVGQCALVPYPEHAKLADELEAILTKHHITSSYYGRD